jgi:hypothetical protein
MSKLVAIVIATVLPTLALAEPLLSVPEPPVQAGPPPATPGGYVTCSIARYCLGQDGKWTPQPAAAEPMPVLRPTGPEPADGTSSR